jgi:hypothetical protein
MFRLVTCLVMLLGLGGCLFMVDDTGTGYLKGKSSAELRRWVLGDFRRESGLADGIHVLGLGVGGNSEERSSADARTLVEVFDKLASGGYPRVDPEKAKELQAHVIYELYGPTRGSREVLDELRDRVEDEALVKAFRARDDREWREMRAEVRRRYGEPDLIGQQAGDEERRFRPGDDPRPRWRVQRERWWYLNQGFQVVMERGTSYEERLSEESSKTLRSLLPPLSP